MAKRSRKKDPRASKSPLALLPPERIERCIHEIRGQRVMLDSDLADFYGVETKALNRAVARNARRFPEDFRFQLTSDESRNSRCQYGTSTWGGRRYKPYAFTEHGALMAATVLKSQRAAQVSVLIIRAFVRLRQILLDHQDLARRIAALEKQFTSKTDEHEAHIARIYEILDDLMNPPEPPNKSRIGFVSDTTTAVAAHPPRAVSRSKAKRTPGKPAVTHRRCS